MMNGRRGYTEIAAGETEPLRETSTSMISPSRTTDPSPRGRNLVCALVTVGVLLGTTLGWTRVPEDLDSSVPVGVPDSQDPTAASSTDRSIRYRPLCQFYDDTSTSVRMIQTSLKEPSRQWSDQPCFPASRHTTLFTNQRGRPPVLPLDAYGSPDAILRVNFSAVAFPTHQTPILGFGGAFTEASGRNYQRLSEQGKQAVMELLFGAQGLGYALGRVHINSCDFSVKSYTFDDVEDDFPLDHFDVGVHHDVEVGMVDMALRATSILRQGWPSEDAYEGNLRLYASPWSPPAWMKNPTWEDAKNATHAAKMTYSAEPTCLREGVGSQSRYAASWALYFSKFVTAYRDLGLPLWGVTVQNEPEFAAPWEACTYTPTTQHDFLTNHLGPQLERDHPDLKIFMFDHNKDHINIWGQKMLNASSNASRYVDGTAYHWYAGGMDRLLDGALGNANLHQFQEDMQTYGIQSNHILFNSEACHCPTTGYAGGDINIYWARAERYAHTILADLAAGSHGWVEWNLLLDSIGGPNHLGNLCESSLLAVPHRALNADPHTPPLPDFETDGPMGKVNIGDGRTREELNALGFPAKFLDVGVAVQPIYYYMGHISRYVRPGSVAVPGIVTANAQPGVRIFRPSGQVVVGGGENDLARHGMEITAWPCEGSTRQHFTWNADSKRHIQVQGHDWLGNPTKSCFARKSDPSLGTMSLTDCKPGQVGIYDIVPIAEKEGDQRFFQIVLTNHPKLDRPCLIIHQLGNDGGAYGPRGGAPVTLGSCSSKAARWKVDETTGEASSTFFSDDDGNEYEVCMTTGWPFLQMGAFLTPNGEAPKTVVILNEAKESANFAIQDQDKVIVTASIPPRSIQTILLQ
jgi:glucosylceramidase